MFWHCYCPGKGHLGGHLGAIWAPLEAIWAYLGLFGPIWGCLDPFWGLFGPQWGGTPRGGPKIGLLAIFPILQGKLSGKMAIFAVLRGGDRIFKLFGGPDPIFGVFWGFWTHFQWFGTPIGGQLGLLGPQLEGQLGL